VPIISFFFGIIINMHFDDHNPPHFHAEYQGREGVFAVADGKLLEGDLAKSNLPLNRIQRADND
jgi:hypothetical protein